MVSPRGQTLFGFAGDLFDQIAENFDCMKWWVSNDGLMMAVVSAAAASQAAPTLDELLGRPGTLEVPAKFGKLRRPGKRDPVVTRIKKKVRALHAAGFGYESICERPGSFDRPTRAGWRDLPWNIAYKKHRPAVTKWLSEACSGQEN
jgi:hypothetical protein